MRGALLVAGRELVERRNVFVAALAASPLPFLAALAPWVGVADGAEARAVVALTLALAFALGAAIVHGATMIGRDLAERRIGFYFSRPLSGLAIWGGKTIAGVLLFALPPVLVLLPTVIAGWPGDILSALRSAEGAAAVLAGGAFLLAAAHAAGIAARSRSPWIAADVAALALTAFAMWYAISTLVAEAAFTPLRWLAVALVAIVFLSVHLAGAVQVCVGRTDSRRGHRVLSLVLWGALLSAATLAVAFCRWVVDVTPANLTAVQEVIVPPSGGAALVGGPARHRGDYYASFLLDTETGRFVRVGPGGARILATYSADGQILVARSQNAGRTTELTEILLGRVGPEGPTLRPTSIALPTAWVQLAASPSGSRIATISTGTLSVWQASGGRLLASTRLADTSGVVRLMFASEGVVRTYRFVPAVPDGNAGDVVIDEFDVDSRSAHSVGRIAGARRFDLILARADAKAERLLWHSRSDAGTELVVLDARSGARLFGFGAEGPMEHATSMFLANGGIATIQTRQGEASLRTFGADGQLVREVSFGRARWTTLGGQPTPGSILVGVSTGEAPGIATSRTELIDLADGSRRLVGERMSPEGTRGWWGWSALNVAPLPGSFASRACRTASGALVEVDPMTGVQRVVVAGGGEPKPTR